MHVALQDLRRALWGQLRGVVAMESGDVIGGEGAAAEDHLGPHSMKKMCVCCSCVEPCLQAMVKSRLSRAAPQLRRAGSFPADVQRLQGPARGLAGAVAA